MDHVLFRDTFYSDIHTCMHTQMFFSWLLQYLLEILPVLSYISNSRAFVPPTSQYLIINSYYWIVWWDFFKWKIDASKWRTDCKSRMLPSMLAVVPTFPNIWRRILKKNLCNIYDIFLWHNFTHHCRFPFRKTQKDSILYLRSQLA